MFRALRSMIYHAVIGGIHDAFKDAGIVDEGAAGTPAEQVRAAIADKHQAEPEPADENEDTERAPRGRKGRAS